MAGRRVPQSRGVVVADRRNQFSIGTIKDCCVEFLGGPFQLKQSFAGFFNIPNTGRSIDAGGGDAFSIWAAGQLANVSADNAFNVWNSLVHLLNDLQPLVCLIESSFGFFLVFNSREADDHQNEKHCCTDAERPANRPPDTPPDELAPPPSQDRRRENVVEDFVAYTIRLTRRRLNGTEDAYLRVRQPFEQWGKAALAAPRVAG